ncbi:hypothetical protein skT53_14500 [Effusibacillus dendaii]|uniref:Uncharacterized protein n=1 Tax=Effusibacillus dendaii TaxID=2743772 RepID=A0A7I8D8Q5_9BACL|nr:hypothetical protein skT53_14500 [Effusibacillus dendaii]
MSLFVLFWIFFIYTMGLSTSVLFLWTKGYKWTWGSNAIFFSGAIFGYLLGLLKMIHG